MGGIYIHIPFCKQACHYCNFHFSTSLRAKGDLIAALLKEIELATNLSGLPQNGKEEIETVYFGGGTPSLLDTTDLQLILNALQKRFFFKEHIEITLEANPDDITTEKLNDWKRAGINRLSVGIQSFVQEELQWMNRAHTAINALECIHAINRAGFTNYSIDLIYGSPLLTNNDWKKNVFTAIEKNIPHLSCYALTVEPKTILHQLITQKKKPPVDAEKQAEQFLLLMSWMEESGYEHYEISNFCKPGMQSRHNSSYWQGKPYYGFGPSAHSFDGKSRQWNIANNEAYIRSLQNNIIPSEKEILTTTQQLNEYIMISLRTKEGLDIERVQRSFGSTFSDQLRGSSRKWEQGQKLEIKNGKIILTKEGKLFADGIAADLFF